jgi:hypothetical protein
LTPVALLDETADEAAEVGEGSGGVHGKGRGGQKSGVRSQESE